MHEIMILELRIILGAMWIVAAASKLASQDARPEQLADAVPVPKRVASVTLSLLPFIELICGGCLILGISLAVMSDVSALLLGAYSAVVWANLANGRTVECHCFGRLSNGPVSVSIVVRNLLFLVMSLAVARAHSNYLTVNQWIGRQPFSRSDPPLSDLIPTTLIACAAVTFVMLGSAGWMAGSAIAASTKGPAVGTPGQALLKRIFKTNP